jgi:hypothetical protein
VPRDFVMNRLNLLTISYFLVLFLVAAERRGVNYEYGALTIVFFK